jgi:transglutaminase-like putative cysteine protease
MALTVIRGYGLSDIIFSMNTFLNRAATSMQFRSFALGIVGQGDPFVEIHKWVQANIRYTPDPIGTDGEPAELFISPLRMMNDNYDSKALGGDCDDMALMTTALFRAVGIDSKILLLDTQGLGLDHAVSMAYSEKIKNWIMVDPSTKKFPLGWHETAVGRVVV